MTPRRRPDRLGRAVLRAPARLYDWRLGWLLGHRFLRLTHLGRRSGRRYRTVLEIVGPGASPFEVVVVAGFGDSADWYRNLRATPPLEVAIGGRRFRPAWRQLDRPEAASVLAQYERQHRLTRPVVRFVLSRLVGWHYDGSELSVRRLVAELPFVAFRPADGGRQLNSRPRRLSPGHAEVRELRVRQGTDPT